MEKLFIEYGRMLIRTIPGDIKMLQEDLGNEENPGSNAIHLCENRLGLLLSYVNDWVRGDNEDESLTPKQAIALREFYCRRTGLQGINSFKFEIDSEKYLDNFKEPSPGDPERIKILREMFSKKG